MLLSPFYQLEQSSSHSILRLTSADGTNRLSRDCVRALTVAVETLGRDPKPLILAGNQHFFSAGADLHEISVLTGPTAYEFSRMGQRLMDAIDRFPAPVYAAVEGYCMGGGLDVALACDRRIAAPRAILGHRGAALGLITGWGGTQRLPRLVGKAKALAMFVAAEKLDATHALRVGLLDAVAEDPVAASVKLAQNSGG
jgi:enoyl-CoA hydratase/carnithine racemase